MPIKNNPTHGTAVCIYALANAPTRRVPYLAGDLLRLRLQDQKDARKWVNESELRSPRILILGDGNFSFSLALARALPPPSFEIVATSFDGPVDLLGKYPESPGIVAALRSLGVTVLHNVDATALDARVVGGAEASSVDGCGSPPTQHHRRQYEHVIFNHPHTGTEDMRRHRSFLGHFFHAVAHSSAEPTTATEVKDSVGTAAVDGAGGSGAGPTASGAADRHRGAKSVLAPGGAIHVTLALDQPERWGLQEQAARHGFSLAHRHRFPAEQIDGYMTKRHQTGRSFQQRVQNSETLSFVWASGVEVDEGEPATAGFGGDRCSTSCSSGSDGQKTCASIGGGGVAAATLQELGCVDNATEEQTRDGIVATRGDAVAPASSTKSLPPWLWPDVNVSGKPGLNADGHGGGGGGGGDGAGPGASAVDNDRRGDVQAISRTSGECNGKAAVPAPAVLLPEVCGLCGKRYKTPQALRTHVRQFHELGQEGGVPLAAKKEEPCPHCGRTFTSSRALDQHVLAKHSGHHVDIKPDWFVGSIYRLEPPPPASNNGGIVREEPANRNSSATSSPPRLGATASTDDRNPHAIDEPVVPESTQLASGANLGATNDDGGGVYQECDVCGFWFASRADAQQHLDNLRPPIEGAVTRYDCRTCAKDFGSRRALLQHANFCAGGGRGGAEAGRA